MSKNSEKVERFWDRSAKRFNARADPEDPNCAAILDLTQSHLQRNDVVLDYGCAVGNYALEIAPAVKEMWGIDISGEMIKAAERNAEGGNYSNVRFLHTDIFDPSLQAEMFHVVLAFNIFHLVTDPMQIIARIKQLLRPDGVLLSVTPCVGRGSSLREMLICCGSLVGILPIVRSFTPDEVEELFRKEGFSQIESRIIPNQIPAVFIAARKKRK